MTSRVYLNTRTANGESNYNTTWAVNSDRLTGMNAFKISVQTVQFPNAVYPTNRFNNVIEVTDGIITATIIVDPGIYTGATLATTLKPLLDATAIGVFTITYDATYTKKLTISCTNPFTWVLVDNSMYESMGLNQNTFNTTNTTWVSEYPVHLSGTQHVDVISNISNLSWTNNASGHVLCRVPIDVPFGNTVFFKNDFHEELETSMLSLTEISFSMRDDKNNMYELPDNMHVSLVLTILDVSDSYNHDRNYS